MSNPQEHDAGVDPRKLEEYDEEAGDEPTDPREEYDPIDAYESLDNH